MSERVGDFVRTIKVFVNNKRIFAPVRSDESIISVLMTTAVGQREWVTLDHLAETLGGKILYNQTDMVVNIIVGEEI